MIERIPFAPSMTLQFSAVFAAIRTLIAFVRRYLLVLAREAI